MKEVSDTCHSYTEVKEFILRSCEPRSKLKVPSLFDWYLPALEQQEPENPCSVWQETSWPRCQFKNTSTLGHFAWIPAVYAHSLHGDHSGGRSQSAALVRSIFGFLLMLPDSSPGFQGRGADQAAEYDIYDYSCRTTSE